MNKNCTACKGTGKITLFTSIVPCDCISVDCTTFTLPGGLRVKLTDWIDASNYSVEFPDMVKPLEFVALKTYKVGSIRDGQDWLNKQIQILQDRNNKLFAEIACIKTSCTHAYAYFKAESDNFYCQFCKKGMGEEFYLKHKKLFMQGNSHCSQCGFAGTCAPICSATRIVWA